MSADFTATVLGLPRIGPNRELKRAVEGYWAAKISRADLEATAMTLRESAWRALLDGGVDSVPTNTFSYYDQMLDTAQMLGALPQRVRHIADPLDRYFAAARGAADVAPLEMTKWFDTNYHYLVPEIGDDLEFALDATGVLDDLALAQQAGVPARPVVIGPVTFLLSSKPLPGARAPIERLDEIVPLYADLLAQLAERGVQWVQFDEPAIVRDLSDAERAAVRRAYETLGAAAKRPSILVASYFGTPDPQALAMLATTDIEALGIDCVAGDPGIVARVPRLAGKLLVAGVVDGRNIWRANLDAALATLGTLLGSARALAVSTSCSLLHVPYSLQPETALDPAVRSWLAFGDDKVSEVAVLAKALRDGRQTQAARFTESARILAQRAADPRVVNPALRGRLDAARATGTQRGPAAQRRARQHERLGLPALPTTTIGSFPQTPQIRTARARLRRDEIDQATYRRLMEAEIEGVIRLQESLGLDVLVHGEPERNDMVQYFAELLEGFAATQFGWVQSYGSRCVRPPILFGDVTRPEPMTVQWAKYAQSLTERPVKGMLTGPVTILAWSFVRDDQPAADSCAQIALAIRDETVDLQAAGVRIIQVDEPALRELLPLRAADQQAYLTWAVDAFRLATGGVADSTQIHTHLCYSEFGEVIGAIAGLDADVTSIEAARSHMEILGDLNESGFSNEVGPGVYDIHSPRVPSAEEMTESLRAALQSVPAERLWVNPDCGLKTRRTDEVTAALRNMVAAAKTARTL